MLAWSGRSPDLIVLDFLFWDYVKNVVCQETFSDLETLWHCITGYCSSDQKCAHEQMEGVGVRYLLVAVEQLMLLIVNMLDDMNTWKQIIDIFAT